MTDQLPPPRRNEGRVMSSFERQLRDRHAQLKAMLDMLEREHAWHQEFKRKYRKPNRGSSS